MNKYARMLLEQHLATTDEKPSPDLQERFTHLGEGVQHSITSLRDEILTPKGYDEDLTEYRIRSQHAYRQAEEAVLAHLLETTMSDDDQDPEDLTSSAADLALISDQLSRLDRDWTETVP